jgi:hypothetical protein
MNQVASIGSAVAEGRQVFGHLPHPQKKMVIFNATQGAEIHCQLNNLVLAVSHIADWLDEIWR